MRVLTAELLSRACTIFLRHAYGGEADIPAAKRPYLHLSPEGHLGPLLVPPVFHTLHTADGTERGAFRLGSTHYPHLKMEVVEQDGDCIFAVDTHDQIRVPADHPDAARLTALQEANQNLKRQIEDAWEAEGLLTFRALLRRDLADE